MASNRFTIFTELPNEIQEMIWDHAIDQHTEDRLILFRSDWRIDDWAILATRGLCSPLLAACRASRERMKLRLPVAVPLSAHYTDLGDEVPLPPGSRSVVYTNPLTDIMVVGYGLHEFRRERMCVGAVDLAQLKKTWRHFLAVGPSGSSNPKSKADWMAFGFTNIQTCRSFIPTTCGYRPTMWTRNFEFYSGPEFLDEFEDCIDSDFE